MTEITSGSGTLTRTKKQSDTPHPHYFNSFQNYCNGPKAKTLLSTLNKDLLPIPEKFIVQADEILHLINRLLIERISEMTKFTSVLPYEFFEQDRVMDNQRYLVDRTMFKIMNDTGVINWMSSLKKLYPVRTSGNGNCLLHAVLIAMVGVHDFNLHLRDRLRQFMNENKEVLKGNWKIERLKTDKIYGIQSEESNLDSEWEELCNLVRYENSDDGQTASNLQFLEAVHIFSISNMLARPIIILSEDVVRNKHGEAISYNDLFGIYLPILSKSQSRVAVPIVLAYDQSHFCPLQTNDLKTNTSADNFLPLYQSIEHARKQTLLPIRFLGNNTSVEDDTRLLGNYLSIKKLAYYPESNSEPLSILCVELGTKHLTDSNDFFLVYYNYILDFSETQKKKLQEEEEEEKRRRDEEYYFHNQSPHEMTQRSLKKTDTSSSPPPPYSSISPRTNENKKPLSNERRPSYGEAVNNGTSIGPSTDFNRPINQYSEPQKPQNNIQTIQRTPYVNENHHHNNNKQYQQPGSNWEPINDDSISNGKTLNYNVINSRGTDSKFKQEQQNPVRIPIHFSKVDSPSNLIDFERKTDRIRPCIICKHYFEDLSSTGLCSECDYKNKHPPPPRHVVIRRSPPTNIYSSAYSNSDFLTPFSLSSSKIRGPLKIICPHCKNLNVVNNMQNGTDYSCSICRTILNIPR